ncbi:acetyltransferase, CysE/LacA/LpxA/NodL family [Paraphaeosphaeria sporulosa]
MGSIKDVPSYKTSIPELKKALSSVDEYQKMLRGELYYSFGPEMTWARRRCAIACRKYNAAEDPTRREQVAMWRDILGNTDPLPPQAAIQEEDDAQFGRDPWVEGPMRIDYGIHITVGRDSFIGPNFMVLDTCKVSIGARVLIGPNVSLYTATHPVDPAIRQGIIGPEMGKEIHIGDDCWIGGGAYILPGVNIGRGVTVGAGSVVTKSVDPFTVVAGNPARVIKRLENNIKEEEEEG